MSTTSVTGATLPAVAPASPGNRLLTLVVIGLAQFMVVLDVTIVNVALPSIQTGLNFSDADLQWVINAYTLVFGGFLLLGGRAADLLGRRRLFVMGVAVFTVASLINGLAGSDEMLILGRALQGLGGALVSPAALSILTTTFTDPMERTKALGVWTAIAVSGGAFGLLVGGVLTDVLSWEWVFIVNVPVGVLALLAALRFVPESRAESGHRGFDVPGALTVTGGLLLLVYGIVKVQEWGWSSTRAAALFAAAVLLLGTFVVVEHRGRAPLMRLGIFRIRALAAANGILLLLASGMFGTFFFCTLYVQNVLGYGPLKAGLAFLPMSAGIMVGAALSQRFMPRIGIRAVLSGGLVLATVGMALLAGAPVDGHYASDLLVGFLPLSVGMGMSFVPITLLATSGVPDEDAGLASGLFNTMQQVGGALGLAVLSTLATNHMADELVGVTDPGAVLAAQVSGFHIAFTGGALLMGLGAVLSAVLLGRRHLSAIDVTKPAEVVA